MKPKVPSIGLTHRDLGSFPDHALLASAFALGVGGIILLKMFWQDGWWMPFWTPEQAAYAPDARRVHYPTIAAAIWAALVLVIYAFVARKVRGRAIEPETTGDNCYYLGFLFTLVSLAITLVQLGSASAGASRDILEDIISGFGIALASTIVGIMLRVLFFQQRADLVARQGELSQELQKAARKFRAQLSASTADMKKFSVESVQLAQERNRRILDASDRLITDRLTAFDKLQSAADEANRRQLESINESAELLKSAIEGSINRSMEHLSSEIANAAKSALQETFAGLDTTVKRLSDSSDTLASTLEESLNQSLSRIPDKIAGAVEEPLKAAFSGLDAAVKQLESSMDDLRAAGKSGNDELLAGLTEVKAALGELSATVETAESELSAGTGRIAAAASGTAEALEDTTNRISVASSALIAHLGQASEAAKGIKISERMAKAAEDLEDAVAAVSRVRMLAESIGDQFEEDSSKLNQSAGVLSARLESFRRLKGTDHDPDDLKDLQNATSSIADHLTVVSDRMRDFSKIAHGETRHSKQLIGQIARTLSAETGNAPQTEEQMKEWLEQHLRKQDRRRGLLRKLSPVRLIEWVKGVSRR